MKGKLGPAFGGDRAFPGPDQACGVQCGRLPRRPCVRCRGAFRGRWPLGFPPGGGLRGPAARAGRPVGEAWTSGRVQPNWGHKQQRTGARSCSAVGVSAVSSGIPWGNPRDPMGLGPSQRHCAQHHVPRDSSIPPCRGAGNSADRGVHKDFLEMCQAGPGLGGQGTSERSAESLAGLW